MVQRTELRAGKYIKIYDVFEGSAGGKNQKNTDLEVS